MNKDHELESRREASAMNILLGKGWVSKGMWIFVSPGGSVHDLSAADLSQIDRIEAEGLFLVK